MKKRFMAGTTLALLSSMAAAQTATVNGALNVGLMM